MSESWNKLLSDDLPAAVDVIVIGAGAAGCVVASRLSAEKSRDVLVLETGSWTPTQQSRTPGTAFYALNEENLHLAQTVPQPGLNGRSVGLPTGKGLGGGSSVNLLAWFQGDPADYDGWAASGASGWDWASVRSTFQKMEHFAPGPDDFHGAGGPIVVDTALDLEPGLLSFVAAGEEVGLEVSTDLNGARRTGVGLVQANIRDGVRHGVVDGYLSPVADRDNLQIAMGCQVANLVLDGTRVVGVALTDGRTVLAREQVVLSAGALRTPQLLMLSGIGPSEHLHDLGIEVVVDSQGVGSNLQDHPIVSAVWSLTSGRSLLDAQDEQAQAAYRLVRRGPLSVLPTVGALFPLSQADSETADGADADGSGAGQPPTIQALVYLLGLDATMTPMPQPAVSVTVALLTPSSRGTLRLASADPLAAPLIDPGYLTAADDLPQLREGVSRVREMMETKSMAGVVGAGIFPTDDASDAEIEDWIRASVQTQWHPAGSAKMGVGPDAVVDEHLSVYGVEGLTVADASVMPHLTRGNIQAPVIMIAERAAEFLMAG